MCKDKKKKNISHEFYLKRPNSVGLELLAGFVWFNKSIEWNRSPFAAPILGQV